ncbi:hypothetical protein DMUE_0339, partial [Dictyocoela muelleri]
LNTKIERKNQQLIKIISILKNEERRLQHKINNIKSGEYKIKKKENIRKNIVINYDFYESYEFFENLTKVFEIYCLTSYTIKSDKPCFLIFMFESFYFI